MTPRTSRETEPEPSDGLDRQDRERASSVADEGGVSGAALEGEDALDTVPDRDGRPIPRWSEEGRRRARRLRRPLLAVALLACSTPAQAAGYFTPFVGAAFGGRTDDSKLTYGGSLTLAGESGIVGFAVDFGYTPDFLGKRGLGDNNMTTLMGDLVLLSPGRTRIYGSAGLGLMKTRVQDVSGFFDVDSNELGLNVGGGVLFMLGSHVGLQGDVRYFRQLTDPEPDDEFDVDLGGLDYWRAIGGLALRF